MADDEQVILDLLFELLHELGYQVDTAIDGYAALELINQNDYDLIFTDIKMPGMDGRQLYNHIMSKNTDLAKRMIFMTGYALSSDMQAFLHGSGHRHIEKPFDINTLRELSEQS